MWEICKISVQKNDQNRYNIFFDKGDGEEYAFSVGEDVLIKYQLKKGTMLDELTITEIQYYDEIHKAYHVAIRFLSRRMRTELEVRKYLQEKNMGDFVIQEAIIKLYEYKFLNDEEYANAYVRSQINTTDKGPDLIIREMKEKGISNSLIENSIQQYLPEMQVEKATKISQKIFHKNSNDSQRLIKQKLEQMLQRKGYFSETIQIAIEEALSNTNDTNDFEALLYQGEKARRKLSNYTGFEYEQKMKQLLFRKGFSIDSINRFLNEDREK
ncbi:recombination regulator RecX [Bacillus sp. 03113]|uniref:recombination regulator RecX n=1 Tax=Bacillus sp. 03113 TaxID=2578211 RepID=UPI001144F997|nr:recombination regulator RecX [Bacillus sp. 03113]